MKDYLKTGARIHLGTGEMVEKKDIPQWKGHPQGEGPFERAACGVLTYSKSTTLDIRKVQCGSCPSTRLYRAAKAAHIQKDSSA